MKVLKFGGTSVANADRIEKVKDIVLAAQQEHETIAVVVSALGGVTDMLIKMGKLAEQGNETYRELAGELFYKHRKAADELFESEELGEILTYLKEKTTNLENLLNGVFLIKELSPRVLDCISSFGELMSSFIIAKYIQKFSADVKFLDSREIIKTDNSFGVAQVDFKKTFKNITEATDKEAVIYLLGGFIASNDEDVTTTLGRGGSDYTAAIIAAGSGAEELEIWTDVNGVMTADPRKVKKSFSLSEMTYEEAMEMSHFGAKVIHPPTIQPVLEKSIPIRIRNTFQPEFPGTLISSEISDEQPVKGVSSIGKVALINVEGSGLVGVTGIAGRLFTALANGEVNIILITQASSEHSICFAVRPEATEAAKSVIEKEFDLEMQAGYIDPIRIEDDLSIVAVIGSNMKRTTGISGRLFGALAKNGINVRAIAQGSSELNISVVIGRQDESKAVNALHDAFFISMTKTVNLFIVGIGLIGSTLLEQISGQAPKMLNDQSLELRIAAVSNSKKMLFNAEGIAINEYSQLVDSKGDKADLGVFVERMKTMNLPNSIFVDNTASKAPVEYYEEVLSSSISIITPNKIANANTYPTYLNYRALARKHDAQFLYETNVGAGLPVISTLKDLLRSGDEILKIEAVLSGSLSFIFNTFRGDKKFSDIVKLAKEKGFTEPDPREDLSGMDVARKALILAREIGQAIELSDINVQNILPTACNEAKTIDDFFVALEASDDYFAKLRDKADEENKVLRFMAIMENGAASVELQMVGEENSFYNLSGSDNMVSFTTKRYHQRPLVVKGPGAGAEVTAAGVFAEIIMASNFLS